ncbi:hypothetical protein [Microcoleus sp. LEGE 07076]|uniref:hypothetical protein n=1 Tax=Microcoleus sp. LEGE 07076 TaxID=915322 RepID=UPI001D147733|nr:hypothetical protein [Microcoleus sp. LEGE 07076]
MRQMQSEADNQEQQPLIVLPGGVGVYTSSVAEELRIDCEFQSLIPPLSKGEKAALQASILEEGCRDPLVVWAEEKLLIDGHNRYAICTAHGIPYQIVEISFDSRNAVKVWTIANQLGRRSLTPESVSYLRGTWYELTKQSHGGKRSASCQNDHLTDKTVPEGASCQNGSLTDKTVPERASCQNGSLTDKTARELGERFKASPRTIYRDAKFTRAVDALSSIGGEDMKWKILNRSAGLTKKEVIALAAEVKSRPTKVAKTLQGRDRQVKTEGEPTIAHHLTLKIGSLVEVYAPDRQDVNGRLGRIQSVGEKTATVWMRHIPTLAMNLHTFKHSALTAVPLDNQPETREICDRIDRLHQLGNLDPFEIEILNLLERTTALTPTELQYLEQIENRHKLD